MTPEPQRLIVDRAGYGAVVPLLRQLPLLKRIILLDGDQTPTDGREVRYDDVRASRERPPVHQIAPDDLMSIVYTSGTTGYPKGCMLSHGYYTRVGQMVCTWLELSSEDRYLTAMPLFHGAARMMVVGAMLEARGAVIIEREFHPRELLDRAIETRATVIGGVGAMGMALLNQPPRPADRSHGLRLASFIPMGVEDQEKLAAKLGITVTTELYGQTECVPMTFNPLSGPANPKSDGRPAPDLELRLVDDDDEDVPFGEVGEIIIRPRGPHSMFKGYWRKPEETLHAFRNLWYHTGDYGRFDEQGCVSFVDRKKDYLRRRGENISSLELEAVITGHPQIAEAAVHDVPSALTESDIKVCVVLAEGGQFSAEDAFGFFKEHVPYFAIPRYVEVLAKLPKNAVSRVMKHHLRERGVTAGTWDLEALGFTMSRADRR